MSSMRPAILLLAALGACKTNDQDEVTNIVEVGAGAVEERPEIVTGENARLVRNTAESVKRYEELKLQGNTQAEIALRNAIAASVDADFAVFRDMALHGEHYLHRNMAVKCLGFAQENRGKARDALLEIADDRDEQPFLRANAMRGIGILRDPETPLTPVVAMLGSGDPNMRTEAAQTFGQLALVRETPRELTPQYLTAIERMATMLYDKAHRRSRRAAAFALGDLRHPDTMPHLLAALGDGDELVQIGALRGLWLLGDQRAIEPVLEYLGDGPTSSAESWAVKVLKQIAVQGGFVSDPAQLNELESSPRKWRDFFREARMK